ncbi:hypothetical protein [Piscinibacter gummiphilus]|uniref:Uncharacterized protein n=1 Tax=Piscinibacter gummiphilus TaxID=946333 RepID=A0ABZ0CTS8_9BURK|nr:hypothetical protein [Piscinibacter gummiphilus]WOB08379.1 hypothetical protein RXV79_26200 [Piscinibacter gummiphilus]
MNTATAYDMIARRNAAQEFNTAWGVTMPADLVTVPSVEVYQEPIRGLVTREVNEPELFKLFFG